MHNVAVFVHDTFCYFVSPAANICYMETYMIVTPCVMDSKVIYRLHHVTAGAPIKVGITRTKEETKMAAG